MHFKFSSIIEYTTWLLTKFHELRQIQPSEVYRIIEIKQSSKGQYKIIIQVIGKSSIIECSPQEIVADDQLLEGFSKKDIRMITYFACEQTKIPKYKITGQEFCAYTNSVVFKLRETENDYIVARTANQIMMDKDLTNALSQEDIKSISYMAGYEHSQNKKVQ